MKVAVLGAGAAGLSAGLALLDRGVDVTVLEALPRAGGKLGSLRKDGFLLETAAIGLLDRQGDLAPLCARLGLRLLSARKGSRLVQRDGVVRPLGPRVFRARELLGAARALFTRRAPLPEETVLDYFGRRAGPAGAFVADAIQTGVYAGDPARLEMASAFPALGRRAVRPLSSFEGGLQELVDAFARALGPALRLGTPVRAVRRDAAGFTLALDGGELRAGGVVCALPAPATQALFPELAPHLGALESAPLALVHFALPAPGPQSFGLLAPGAPVVGLLFPAALWAGRAPPGRALATALVGGARHPAAAALPDEALAALARAHMKSTLGLDAGAPLAIVRWPAAIPQPTPGHARRMAALDAALPPGLALAGAWYRGVSVLDCLRQGRAAAAAIHAR